MAQQMFIKQDGSLFSPVPGLKPQPVFAWETDPESGKRRPSTVQERDLEGKPIWEQQVVVEFSQFGRPVAEIVGLRWAGEPVLPGTAEGFPAPKGA